MGGILRCCHNKLPVPDQHWCWLLTKAKSSRDKKSLSSWRKKGDFPDRTLFHSAESITSSWAVSAYCPLSGQHMRTVQLPLHVLGFPHVLRLGPVASLYRTIPDGMWFWQLGWQLSFGKWLKWSMSKSSCKGWQLSDNHFHWFLYSWFFQFTQYFDRKISSNCILPGGKNCYFFQFLFHVLECLSYTLFSTPPSLVVVI